MTQSQTMSYTDIIVAHETILSLAKAQISQLSSRNEHLEKHLRAAQSRNSQAPDPAQGSYALGEYKRQVEQLQHDLDACRASEKALEGWCDKLNEQLGEMKSVLANYENQNAELTSLNESSSDELEKTSGELVSAREKIAALEKDRDKFISVLKIPGTDSQAVVDVIRDMRKNVESISKDNEEIAAENRKLYTDLDAARKDIGAQKAATKKAEEQLSETAAKLDAVTSEKNSLEAEITKLESQPIPVTTDEELQKRISRAADHVIKAMEETEDYDKQLKALDRARLLLTGKGA